MDFGQFFFQLFDGTRFTVGSIPSHAPDASITFSPGETLVGDFELDGNGIGTRCGRIFFKTSKGQTFEVGDQHTPYIFDSGNSFLTGFFGLSGTEVDQLGLFLMKPIAFVTVQNVSYPTLDSYTFGLTPKIYQSKLCNDDPHTPQQQKATFTKTVGTSRTWSVSTTFSVGASISVTAGVPEIAEIHEEFHWDLSVTGSYSATQEDSHSQSMEYPVTVPARTLMVAQFSWWDSQCTIPYTANLVLGFKDGSTAAFPIKDTFSGAFITNAVSNYHSVPLKRGQSCP